MKIVTPHDINLVSTNVAANAEAEWDTTTNFSYGQRCQVTTSFPHTIYEATRSNNINKPPASWLVPRTVFYYCDSSLTIGTGLQSLTVAINAAFEVGMEVAITKTSTPLSFRMQGEITAYVPSTGFMQVMVSSVTGTGTYDSWKVTTVDEIGYWREIGSTNQHAMFDEYGNTQTDNTTEIITEHTVSNADSVTLFGLAGARVEFELWNSGKTELLWSNTLDLSYGFNTLNNTSSLYEFFFGIKKTIPDVAQIIPILVYSGVLIIKIITATGETAKCGKAIIGRTNYIGQEKFSFNLKGRDFSNRTEDSVGRITATDGYWAKRPSFTMRLTRAQVDYAYTLFQEMRGVKTAFISESGYSSAITYGIWDDFDIEVPTENYSWCSMTVLGLT